MLLAGCVFPPTTIITHPPHFGTPEDFKTRSPLLIPTLTRHSTTDTLQRSTFPYKQIGSRLFARHGRGLANQKLLGTRCGLCEQGKREREHTLGASPQLTSHTARGVVALKSPNFGKHPVYNTLKHVGPSRECPRRACAAVGRIAVSRQQRALTGRRTSGDKLDRTTARCALDGFGGADSRLK